MKIIDLYENLIEAPVVGYDVIGDLTKTVEPTIMTSSRTGKKLLSKDETDVYFSNHDIKHIKNNKIKIEEFFENTKYPFRLIFANFYVPAIMGAFLRKEQVIKELKVHEEHMTLRISQGYRSYPGRGEYEDIEHIDTLIKLITDETDAINIIYRGNYGDYLRPLSPWIVAHRLGHIISSVIDQQDSNGLISFIGPKIEKCFSDMLKWGSFKNYQYDDIVYDDSKKDNIPLEFYHKIGTFKSARHQKTVNRGEFFIECFAQFIKDGKITWNTPFTSADEFKNYFIKHICDDEAEAKKFFENPLGKMIENFNYQLFQVKSALEKYFNDQLEYVYQNRDKLVGVI